MHERMKAKQAEEAYNASMAAAQSALVPVVKPEQRIHKQPIRRSLGDRRSSPPGRLIRMGSPSGVRVREPDQASWLHRRRLRGRALGLNHSKRYVFDIPD